MLLPRPRLALLFLLLPSTFALAQQTTFTKITLRDTVNDRRSSFGVSWGDYDNDGFLDLFVANNGTNFLYRNNGNGSFTRVTEGAIVNDVGSSRSASWGDYDNDGDLDLFIAKYYAEKNFLYRNNGNGTFTKVTNGIIVNDSGDSRGSSWGDYDNDGDLDLFVANDNNQSNFLYQNNGNDRFVSITEGPIATDQGNSNSSNWADYDNDGDLDLFVTNFGLKDFLYRNDSNGTFAKITEGVIVNDGVSSLSSSWGDYDNDGDFDLFVANGNQNNSLYQNNGNGTFIKITEGVIVNDRGASVSSSWGDYDNDGDLDLFVANYDQNNSLYQNNSDGTFTKIMDATITNHLGYSLGCSWGDYDNDGDLDLFVANAVGNLLYQNNGNGNNWINIHLTGVVSNRSAIGAKVKMKATIGGRPVWQTQKISGQTGSASQNSLNVEFGLGTATIIDSIQIRWPSGIIQDTAQVAVNQFVKIVESRFTRVDRGVLVNDVGSSRNSSWGDYDIDGDLDLFVATDRGNLLYQNNGHGIFTKIIEGGFINEPGVSTGSWGDYDNDGDLDLFVDGRSFLYKNNGTGEFIKIVEGATANDGGYAEDGSWGDYDNDGDLDLFVANCCKLNNFLYQNNGNGDFTKITKGEIVNNGGYSQNSNWGDYDNDGDLDLFVANLGENNFLYQNTGSGSFTKITDGAIVNDGGLSLGSSWGDYDNDGDLFVANTGDNFLYQNNGGGFFIKVTEGVIVTDGGLSSGSSWGDYDNDGDLDLFVANYDLNNFIYQNNGNGTFTKITEGTIDNDLGHSWGSSWGDYDNDGDLDLFVSSSGGNSLYQNNGNNNSWINVRLIGTTSNVSAIGARVRILARVQDVPVWQMQDISGQTGYNGQNSLNVEFGLKKAAVIDTVQIRWPSRERTVNVYTNVKVNQFLTYRENNRPQAAHPISHITLSQVGSDSTLDINAAPPLFEDLDHDTLTYSVLSSNAQIATASVSGSMLTVALESDKFSGRARITVSADDGRVDDSRGNTEETSFEINRPPFLLKTIPNQIMSPQDSSRFLSDFSEIFLDPDGDVPEDSLSNSDSTVAIVTIRGTSIVASVRDSLGEATITLFAYDRRGGTRSTSFKIINTGANTPPRVAGSGIAEQVLIIAAQPFTQALYTVFNDAEHDSLIFAARSSNRNIALALVENDTLTLVPIALGNAQITVTANDGRGGEVATSFHVTVALSQAPQITHNPFTAAQLLNTPITVTATITDDDIFITG